MTTPENQTSIWRTMRFAIMVSVVCALAVSLTAVQLRQQYANNLANEKLNQLHGILQAIGVETDQNIHRRLESVAIALASGEMNKTIDVATYDARQAALDPANSTSIPPDMDLAGIKRRENHAVVHFLRDNSGDLEAIIFPIWGIGYQSALHGYLALSADAQEVLAIKFYEQGETPGLGNRIQEPAWEQLWSGQPVYNQQGDVILRVGGNWSGEYSRIDGISGATRTSQGVEGLVRFWLGDFGFGPLIAKIRTGEVQ